MTVRNTVVGTEIEVNKNYNIIIAIFEAISVGHVKNNINDIDL